MISVSEAHQIIRDSIPEPEVETVSYTEAVRRVLAEEIRATFPQPRFDNSAMDGFAIRWKDTRGASRNDSVNLRLKGEISAGSVPGISLEKSECARVMTGAPIPKGADAVVMVEHTSGFDSKGEVQFYRPAKAGENIRFKSEEIEKGEVVVPAGGRIGTSEMGTLVTFGYPEVKVYLNPRVTVFVTGDELRSVGQPLKPGEIYNSNLPLMKDLAQKVGAGLVLQEGIRDNPSQLRQFLERAQTSSNIIVSSGGVSMGRYDFVRSVLTDMGFREGFWGVAQKPGKPLLFGTLGKSLVFGLPGNPVSAFICFIEYVWPTCERWMGLEPSPKLEATLAEPFPRDSQKHRFLFGRLWIEEGMVKCAPTKKLGSHMLTSAVGANGILESEPGDDPLKEGERITVSLLPWEAIGNTA